METIEADVVIVGGGPAGCSCALYTSRADLKTIILDKNPSVGALAITHQIANYPGVPTDMSGEALLDLMRQQAICYGTDYRRAQVFGVDVAGDWKTVYTPEGTFKGRSLVLASGAMGRPASFNNSASFNAHEGSFSEGFKIKVFPQAIAIGNIHIGTIAGKLNGVIPATTPKGCLIDQLSTFVPTFSENSPLIK